MQIDVTQQLLVALFYAVDRTSPESERRACVEQLVNTIVAAAQAPLLKRLEALERQVNELADPSAKLTHGF